MDIVGLEGSLDLIFDEVSEQGKGGHEMIVVQSQRAN